MVADREDDQIPEPAGQGNCTECGKPLAPDQHYCLSCGARRGLLPGAVAGTVAAATAKGEAAAPGDGTPAPASDGDGEGDAGWSWMPSPQAIAIAVIGMLALGVGLGSAMSEIASSAPLSTILLEYPHHAVEAPPPAEEEEEAVEEEIEEPVVAEATEEVTLPEEVVEEVTLPAELPVERLPEGGEGTEEKSPLQESLEQVEQETKEREQEEAEGGGETLPEIKHAWLIVLGENSFESTYSATAEAPYLSRVLPKKGELIPNYYGVTGGVLANEIALLSGQGPTPETAVNCPNYAAIAPGAVSLFAEQVEGNGCVYGKEVESLPTQLEEKELTWRAYVESMENGSLVGQPWRCRKPALGGPDYMPTPLPGDQYTTWRNPVVYFSAVAENAAGCEKHDVGFEILAKDLAAKKKTPALSLIFPDACHAGGEVECEPGAPKGAQGAASLLKTLVPAIMASPAYEEGGGLIMITSAQAPQAGEHPDPSACCLAPEYPNLPAVPATTTLAPATTPEEATTATPTTYGEESVLESGGGGQVGLLLISPLVLPGSVVETEYANHFTLLKTLETMFGVEPLGYAAEAEVPTLSPELFVAATEAAEEGS
jgi:hypothetical protein